MQLRHLICALAVVAACKGDKDSKTSTASGGEGSGTGTASVDTDGDGEPDAAPAQAKPGNEHTAWEMAPNRHLAHLLVDGDLVIDGGSPGFARYTRFGLPSPHWKVMKWVDGQPTAEPMRSGSIEFPLTAAQSTATQAVQLRVHSTKAGKVTVKINGRKLDGGRASVVAGWQEIVVPAAGAWTEGENQVVIESNLDGDDLHIRWIRFAHDAAPTGDPLARVHYEQGGWKLTDGAALAWYVLVPDGATLVASVDGKCKVEVEAKDGDATMAGGLLTGKDGRVELTKVAGHVVRLELRARECAAGGTLTGGQIVLPGVDAPKPPDGAPPKYVFFWVMDATRADKIPTFTPGARAETPNFDRLGKDGAVFRTHYVGGNESQVSHSSMFTSLYPAVHTVRTAGNSQTFVLPKKLTMMGQALADAGYYTIGVTANGFIGKWGGYARGFEEFRNMMQEKGVVNGRLFGEEVLADVLSRLDKHKDDGKPLFFFMGTVDNHSPWIAREPWMTKYDPGPYSGPFQTQGEAGPLGLMKGKMGCHKVPPERDIERLRTIYDSAISYQDDLLGKLVAHLEQLGIADQTMIVVTADHGEELFEEKRCGHGASLRDSLARVPLLVHYPARVSARVVDEGSEGIDILPTILDTIGAPGFDAAQGMSLRPLAAGDGAGWVVPAIASQYEYAFAMRLGRWKARVKRGAPLILDMVSDPMERTDLSDTRPVERRYLTDHLSFYLEYREEWHKATWGVVTNMTEAGAAAMEAPPS